MTRKERWSTVFRILFQNDKYKRSIQDQIKEAENKVYERCAYDTAEKLRLLRYEQLSNGLVRLGECMVPVIEIPVLGIDSVPDSFGQTRMTVNNIKRDVKFIVNAFSSTQHAPIELIKNEAAKVIARELIKRDLFHMKFDERDPNKVICYVNVFGV